MRFVSYNMRSGGKLGQDNTWQQVIGEFAPDIVFAQESLHPSKYFSASEFTRFTGCVHEHVHHGKWGSAILSRNHHLEPLALPSGEYKGWVVGALISDVLIGGATQPIAAFSIHAPSPGPYERHVKNIIAEIAQTWKGVPLILAGDFNLTTAAIRRPSPVLKNTPGELQILEMLKTELSLFSAWQHLHPNDDPPQTLRWTGNTTTPYHCDAVFLGNDHLESLMSADVKSTGVWGTLSDHNPVIVELK
jgi:endonuclease/exonuclease/phosphatase family metal-dependent hydrolase